MPRQRRCSVETETVFDPEQAGTITVPTLMLVGGDSPDEIRADPEAVAAALPDARIVILEGQQHVADVLVPEVFAEHVVAFLRDPAVKGIPRYHLRCCPGLDRVRGPSNGKAWILCRPPEQRIHRLCWAFPKPASSSGWCVEWLVSAVVDVF